MPLSSSSRVPASLSSLPIELLTQIAIQLDRKSALSLALVVRAFTLPADHRIWRDLDLSLNPNYGEYPLVQPHRRSGSGAHVVWAKAEAKKAEDRHRQGLREKVKRIMVTGSARRLGMVEKVTAIPRPGAVNAILALLDVVSPNLKHLQLDASAAHVFASEWEPMDYETIDVRFIDYGLAFPALTHLTITKGSVRYAEMVIMLCQASPNLISINVDMRGCTKTPTWDHEFIPFPLGYSSPLKLAKLVEARLSFGDRDGRNDEDVNPLTEILGSAQHLRRLSLKYDYDDYETVDGIITDLSAMSDLEELYFDLTPSGFCSKLDAHEPGFPSLRRLVLVYDEPLEFFEYLPSLPRLESVYVERSRFTTHDDPPAPTPFPEPTSSPSMLPDFAKSLRGSPSLAIINTIGELSPADDVFARLDELETQGSTTGVVRSFVYGGQELLHARLFLRHSEVADTLTSEAIVDGRHTYIEYIAKDGSDRVKSFETRSEARWQDFVDFDGYKVPLKILQKMRVAQGASLAEWQGRGVEVGDEAWKILTDWRDAQDAKAAVVVTA